MLEWDHTQIVEELTSERIATVHALPHEFS